MDLESIAKLAVNYGLSTVLTLAMAIFLAWLLKYVLSQNEKRETRLSELIVKDIATNTKAISDHDDRAAKSISMLEEAHRRQREEHEKQLKILEKIEEENERRREAQIQIITALTAINVSLAELNKKEIFFQKKRTV